MVFKKISQPLSPNNQLKNDAVPTPPLLPPPPPQPQPLGQQTSIYSLTMDEYFNRMINSNKDLGSMNMDEFLNTLLPADHQETQSGGATMQPPQPAFLEANNGGGISQQPMVLEMQGSLISLPEQLSTKTVDEVWKGIQSSEEQYMPEENNDLSHHRQVTCGEITMEEFLFKVGVSISQSFIDHESSAGFASPPNPNTQFHGNIPSNYSGTMNTNGGAVYYNQPPQPLPPLQHQQISTVTSAAVSMEVAQAQVQLSSGGGSFDRETKLVFHGNIPPNYSGTMNTNGGGAVYYRPLPPQQPQQQFGTVTAAAISMEVAQAQVQLNSGGDSFDRETKVIFHGNIPPNYNSSGTMNTYTNGAAYYTQPPQPQPPQQQISTVAAAAVSMDVGEVLQVSSGDSFDRETKRKRRKRKGVDGEKEVVSDRRRKRMIKNRESAARSRARKQEYIGELEAEMERLKLENATLKNEVDVMTKEMQKQKDEEAKGKAQTSTGKNGGKLRRSASYNP